MKKGIMVVSAVVVSVVLIGLAFAAGPGGFRPRTPEEKIEFLTTRIAEKLTLDDAQKATLDRMADEIIAEKQRHNDERQAFKAQVMDTLSQETVTPEELKALFDTRKPAIEGFMQLASTYIAEFHSILTPEQREILVDEIESHQGRRCRFFR